MQCVFRLAIFPVSDIARFQEEEQNKANFVDEESGVELESAEVVSLLEWFANEYRKFGCVLEFVTNRSQEGSQFCRGEYGPAFMHPDCWP